MITDIFELPRAARSLPDMNQHFVALADSVTAEWVSPIRRDTPRGELFRTLQLLIALVAGMLVLLLATGCASTAATYRSGVAAAFPETAPYYAGVRLD